MTKSLILQEEKKLQKGQKLYFGFVDLEKAFHKKTLLDNCINKAVAKIFSVTDKVYSI